jgi:hypothetical protein
MQTKWYVRSFIVLLVLIGISLEQIAVPNQQIVVEFAHDDVTFANAQQTIASVKTQLETIGAKNINVQETKTGTLKITYYSAFDTIAIKNMLSSANDLVLDYTYTETSKDTDTPANNTSVYKLDVYEIQQQSDLDSDLNGLILAFETKTHRCFIPDVHVSLHCCQVTEKNKIEKVSFILQRNQSLEINPFAHKIPEVRAGPRV